MDTLNNLLSVAICLWLIYGLMLASVYFYYLRRESKITIPRLIVGLVLMILINPLSVLIEGLSLARKEGMK